MNLMDLFVKIGVDKSDFDKGLDSASSKAASFASKIGNGIKAAAKVGAAAVTTASVAVGKLLKDSVDAYADYEQLVGGVETLFKDSADIIMGYAENAYKTAGLSANEYMETATSFSAALLQGLGGDTEKAAHITDMAISDMADNMNKMGSSWESIQNAYMGFSKQNYTMLDNLKLGYGGTKSEMERLLADAQKLSGVEYNIENLNEVYEAIHVIQQEMGITGTTAKEAATTISGSVASMKSAWQNLITGLADDNADLDTLINNVVDSAETAFNNILPVAEKALSGIGTFVEKIAPIIADKLPGIVEKVLPSLLSAATALVSGVVAALPSILQVLIEQAPIILSKLATALIDAGSVLMDTGWEMISMLAESIISALPELIPAAFQLIFDFLNNIADHMDLIIDTGVQLIDALLQGILNMVPVLVDNIPEIIMKIVSAIIEHLPDLINAGIQIIEGLIVGISSMLASLIAAVKGVVDGLIDGFKKLLGIHSPSTVMSEIGVNIIKGLIEGIKNMFGGLKDIVSQAFGSIKDGFVNKLQDAKNWGKDMIDNFTSGIKDKWNSLKDTVSSVASTVKDFLGFSEPEKGPLSNFHTYAPDMMKLFAEGIRQNEHLVTDQIAKSFDFDDMELTQNVSGSFNVSNAGASSGSFGSKTITINVYGAQGQDINELAEIIEERLSNALYRQEVGALA